MCEILPCEGLSATAVFLLSIFNIAVLGVLALSLAGLHLYRYLKPLTGFEKRLVFLSRAAMWLVFAGAMLSFNYMEHLHDAHALIRFAIGILVISELMYNLAFIDPGIGKVRASRFGNFIKRGTDRVADKIRGGVFPWTRN